MPNKMIKVGLSFNTNKLEIIPYGTYNLYSDRKLKGTLENNLKYKLGIYKGKRVVVSKMKVFGQTIYLKGKTDNSYISINNKRYRGNLCIRVRQGKNKFSIINELDIEDYLYGVIAKEVSPSWHIQAIKAQAVTARTYTLRNQGRHKNQGFDLCDNVHCQVYGGIDAEHTRTNQAVNETRGEVLGYKGKLASVFYHSCCGGYTENVMNVWPTNKPIPYLSGRRCSFCKNISNSKWETFLSYKDLTNTLRNAGYNAKKVTSAKIKSFTRSGRVKEISFKWGSGKVLTGNNFRALIGPAKLRSTKFKIIKKKDGIKIIGIGNGHGVGLCQFGSKVMAERGYSYRKILDYYFPDTEIELWDKITD